MRLKICSLLKHIENVANKDVIPKYRKIVGQSIPLLKRENIPELLPLLEESVWTFKKQYHTQPCLSLRCLDRLLLGKWDLQVSYDFHVVAPIPNVAPDRFKALLCQLKNFGSVSLLWLFSEPNSPCRERFE